MKIYKKVRGARYVTVGGLSQNDQFCQTEALTLDPMLAWSMPVWLKTSSVILKSLLFQFLYFVVVTTQAAKASSYNRRRTSIIEGMDFQVFGVGNVWTVIPLWTSLWIPSGIIAALVLIILLCNRQRTIFLKRRAQNLQELVEKHTFKIQAQKEEISMQNEELVAQAEILARNNAELETRIKKRTETLNRLNEELIDRNYQLEQFSFITAHNIRGPLARIKGLVHLLLVLKIEMDDDILGHLDKSVIALEDIVQDLSYVLSVNDGARKKFEAIQLREELLSVLDSLRADIELAQAEIDISEFEDLEAYGSKTSIQSIFYHLIHNAIKYSSSDRKLMVKCCALLTADQQIVMTVGDNGLGIDMRYAQEKIFQFHQRFHPHIPGRGCGLFLVKTLVKAMGGRIRVESKPDEGARFIIEFDNSKSI
ncbi:sensor histidine kinase [Chryseolinea soli]|uniref:histidine kinase n=1 Tax=Chryseolinea soli TaxID=2321403 RepID=A0A385SQ10_9BACT|nr:HAMP domain-containing sensor histidine kinase [Chryseolinea soli]AYB32045.1 sensor histidine kinase [Chryseolinea soli]